MRIPGLYRVKRLAWTAKRWLLHPSLVLLYHRIAEENTDPWALCVTPKHFAEHLDVLRSHGLTIDSLSNVLSASGNRRDAVAITFDDGYADNLHSAAPIMERYDAPATFFIVTGQVDGRAEFWWDDLERCVLSSKVLPETLSLDYGDVRRYWGPTDYGPPRTMCDWRGWHAPATERQRLYKDLYAVLHLMDAHARAEALGNIREWAACEATPRPTHRSMTWDELHRLKTDKLFELGAHTVNHVSLAGRDDAEQRWEIGGSKRRLEERLDLKVKHFSYPHGGKENYDARTISILKDLDFANACSNFAGGVTASTDRYQIPRMYVEDWDGDEFARSLGLQSSRVRSFASNAERNSCDDSA
jgi:peptidoglycan/xylan/chitin deacetylase (PgdA/CDA1 family)